MVKMLTRLLFFAAAAAAVQKFVWPAAQRRRESNRVDAESEDSFPASDPPSWTASTASGISQR